MIKKFATSPSDSFLHGNNFSLLNIAFHLSLQSKQSWCTFYDWRYWFFWRAWKSTDPIRDIFQKQTLGVTDDTKLTKEQNTKAFKLWVIQFSFDGLFKKNLWIFQGKADRVVLFWNNITSIWSIEPSFFVIICFKSAPFIGDSFAKQR